MITHSAALFTWSDHVGAANASDLPAPFSEQFTWDGQTHLGFKVRSPKSGNVLQFFRQRQETVNGDRLIYTEYITYDDEFSIKIHNDMNAKLDRRPFVDSDE